MSSEPQQEFYRIAKLPPYVFAVINEMKAKARAAQLDVVDSAWEIRMARLRARSSTS